MNFIQEYMKEQGYELKSSSGKTPKDKVLYQAEVMLDKLGKIKSVNGLNYEGSAPTWWGGKALANGKRNVQAYYGGKRVEGTAFEVENTVEDIAAYIGHLHAAFEKAPDSFFEEEEKRRANITPREPKEPSTDPK